MVGKRIVALGLFALVALTLGLFAASGTEAQSYKPANTYTVVNPAGGVATNNTMILTIPAPGYNYEDSSMYSFTPVDWWTPMGSELPFGAGVGTLSSSSTLGVFNAACKTDVTPNFKLYNAITDNSNQLTPAEMAWTNTANPIPYAKWDPKIADYLEGYPHFLNIMLDPDGPSGPQPPLKPRARYAGDNMVAGSNMLIEVIILSPDQIAQLPGIKAQMVAGMGYVFLTALNNPVDQEEKPGSVSDFCTPLKSTTTFFGTTTGGPTTGAINDGCPAVDLPETGAQCIDDADAQEDGAPDKINDGCLQVGATAETGTQCDNNLDDDGDPANEAGFTGTKNPVANSGVLASGTHIQRNFSQSERDADGDAIENDADPCPNTPDALWVPRVDCVHPGAGDHDCDGLPDSCDPDPQGASPEPDPIPLTNCSAPGTQTDCDGDGYNNRQDICPLVDNGCKTVACGPTSNPAWDNQADNDSYIANADLGPSPDSIADVCDDSDDDGREDGGAVGTCNDGVDNGTVGGPDGLIDGNDPDCIASAGNNWTGMDAGEIVHWGSTSASVWGTNPGTGLYYQGMAWAGVCIGAADADSDGYCDALETALGSSTTNGRETGAQCADAIDNDVDGLVNDGCPQVGDYAESGAQCANAISDDTPTPDNRITFGEVAKGVAVNDGCPAIGVPESLVIDAVINAPGAIPSGDVLKSCNDGVDNDADTTVDAADNTALGCNPAHASYTGDADKDGKLDASDNCSAIWNPEQRNTEAVLNAGGAQYPLGTPLPIDATGDVCDDDDDNDLFTDALEWYLGTDPLDNCPNIQGTNASDAWALDMNKDTFITVAGDVFTYAGKIGARVSTAPPATWANRRLDLNKDDFLTVAGDVFTYAGKIGQRCA